jgi:hypothetical protein
VLLEKVPGVALVDKLWAILLMEGDFNFFNKWLFSHVAVNKLYKLGYIPEDQYSKKSSTAEDSKLDNRLTMDLSRQFRQLLITVSADADKCYNQINHISIMSLLLLAIGGGEGPISAMFWPIQQMRFFQCMGRGDSDTFMGGQPSCNPLQGLCQGNGAARACWIMLSSLMMSVYRQGGHMSTTVSLISREVIEFMGEIYVDDTNLLTFPLEECNIGAVLKQAQTNLDKWLRLLIATGRSLNPDKCYWYLISYICKEGVWEYNRNDSSYKLSIPLPDVSREEIIQLPVSELKKMLGVLSSPDGLGAKHLQEGVVGKTRTWINRLRNANLPIHLAWKAYRFQLGPAICYGISTLANHSKEIEDILHSLEFKMLSCLGVNRHIKTEWWRLAQQFGEIGLFNLFIEQFIGWVEMVLQHYETGSTISKKM